MNEPVGGVLPIYSSGVGRHAGLRWLRPERVVTAPDGRTWEIYVGRATGLRWRPSDYDSQETYGVTDAGSLIWVLLEIPLFLFNQVFLPAVRYVAHAPFALARSRVSDRWSVEAVCWWPSEQRIVWNVGGADRDRVTAEIAAGLGGGHWVTPVGSELVRQSEG